MSKDGFTRRAAAPAVALLVLGAIAAGAIALSDRGKDAMSSTAVSPHEEVLELVTRSGVHRIGIEVARTPDQQALGLMYRTSLAEDKGMLFPHDEPRESSMWMRNTYIPLDMVFIRADGTVHRIEKRTEPFSERIIPSNGPVAAVLELAGGVTDKIGLAPGDKVRHVLFESGGR